MEITAHNHGFAVDAPMLSRRSPRCRGKYGHVEVSHIGERRRRGGGLRCLDIPAISVQYHPEAAAGPHDASYLFDRFIDLMVARKDAR
ncbi:MAG: hypothetical protein U0P48_01200 [Ancrocorticia sp.]